MFMYLICIYKRPIILSLFKIDRLSFTCTEARWGHSFLTDLWWVCSRYRIRFRNWIVPFRYRIRYQIQFQHRIRYQIWFCRFIAIWKIELFNFSGTKRVKTKPSNLSLHKNRIFKQKRIIQVQSWKLKSHWEILASTKKIILESYFWFWKNWLPKLCLLELKWPQRKIWLCFDFIFISGTCFLLTK